MRGPPPAWIAELVTAPLAPAVLRPDGSAAVWALAGQTTSASVSEQFTARAADYHSRYAASAHFEALFRQAMAAADVRPGETPLILDLGAGSGANSVAPCFSIFPAARQVATDLSADLLAMLAAWGDGAGVSERLACVAMDVMADRFAPRRFDLVTGSAILHHLTEPHLALVAAARALKPGGRAIFLEPFNGYGVLRLAYERILAEAELRADPLPPRAEAGLRAMAADIAARTQPDVTSPRFAAMDDKWLFSRSRMEVMARDANFSEVRFVPHNDQPHLYRDSAQIQLRLFGGEAAELPGWAVEILDSFDRALPAAAKRELMLEGTIVLTKGPTRAAAA